MELEQVRFGQRVRVNVPGVGDHGKAGTVKKVLNNRIYVHVDGDERSQHTALFYAADLELIPDASMSPRSPDGDRERRT